MTKHLISLIDGTWQTASNLPGETTYSNVYNLNLTLDHRNEDEEPQIVFYSRGLGAIDGPQKYLAGGFAHGIAEEIEDVYINIASNYESGDKIYIFGFSRGSVIARVAASLIAKIGLLQADRVDLFPEIWKEYKKYERRVELTQELRTNIIPDVKVDFLGVFDTVYGGNLSEHYFREHLHFASRQLSENIRHGIHMLAIDEQRRFFKPLLWESGSHPHQSLEQIWIPGVHSDIGGSYVNNFIANVSLLTMIDKVQEKAKGIKFLESEITKLENKILSGMETCLINNEWTGNWGITKWIGGKYDRPSPPNAAFQFKHLLVDFLKGKQIMIRKKRRTYEVKDWFDTLDPVRNIPRCTKIFNSST